MLVHVLLLTSLVKLSKPMDQWGREFLVTFVRNYDQTGENAIYVTARDAATVTVHNELYSNSSSHNVAAQSSVRVSLPTDLHYTEQGVVEMKAVYVNATGDVSVYVVNHRDSSAGLYTAFPIQTMGTRYILYTYTPTYGTYFVIAALYDNTSVSVLLTLKGTGSCLGGLTNGQTATATLNRHSVWGGWCSGQTSFEGSVVTSNKPVTVITGLKCDTVPVNVNFCDHMVEMMPPVEDFGRTFILHNVQYRTSGAIYRVFSAHDNTELMESPGTTRTLNKGEYFDYDLGAASAVELCVVTSQPVLVLMMTKGADTDPSVVLGDPYMAILPPAENFTSEYLITLEIMTTGTFNRYIAVTARDGDLAGLILPSTPTFTSIGCGYSVGHLTLDANTHWLRHSSGAPFGVMMYAFGVGTGLAAPAGMQLLDKYDYCQSEPCLNGATCENDAMASTYVCTCVAGYTGSECETDIDDCTPNPCQNGATCTDDVNRFNCTCVAGYTGSACETDIDDCLPSPCQNGATCVDVVNGFNCTCSAGYTGSRCETDIDDYTPSPCQNGATCVDAVNGYSCTCLAGYTGNDCETNIDDCVASPCQNGATCVDDVNNYNCTCLAGYTGAVCETNIDDCTPDPCQNGATCVDGVNSYNCTCTAGYTGTDCESVVPTTPVDITTESPLTSGQTTAMETTSSPVPGDTSPDPVTSTLRGTTGEQPSTDNIHTTVSGRTTTDAQTQTTVTTASSSHTQHTTTSQIYQGEGTTVKSGDGTVKSSTTIVSGKGGECVCNCKSKLLANLTLEERQQQAEDQAEQLKKDLAVDKAQLSSTIRKVTSAPDHRPSATGIGYVGIVFLVLSFGAIVVMDITGYFHIMHAPAKDIKDTKKPVPRHSDACSVNGHQEHTKKRQDIE